MGATYASVAANVLNTELNSDKSSHELLDKLESTRDKVYREISTKLCLRKGWILSPRKLQGVIHGIYANVG